MRWGKRALAVVLFAVDLWLLMAVAFTKGHELGRALLRMIGAP